MQREGGNNYNLSTLYAVPFYFSLPVRIETYSRIVPKFVEIKGIDANSLKLHKNVPRGKYLVTLSWHPAIDKCDIDLSFLLLRKDEQTDTLKLENIRTHIVYYNNTYYVNQHNDIKVMLFHRIEDNSRELKSQERKVLIDFSDLNFDVVYVVASVADSSLDFSKLRNLLIKIDVVDSGDCEGFDLSLKDHKDTIKAQPKDPKFWYMELSRQKLEKLQNIRLAVLGVFMLTEFEEQPDLDLVDPHHSERNQWIFKYIMSPHVTPLSQYVTQFYNK